MGGGGLGQSSHEGDAGVPYFPPTSTAHWKSCPMCRECLQDYLRAYAFPQQMGYELSSVCTSNGNDEHRSSTSSKDDNNDDRGDNNPNPNMVPSDDDDANAPWL
jgi:hypothetical protein